MKADSLDETQCVCTLLDIVLGAMCCSRSQGICVFFVCFWLCFVDTVLDSFGQLLAATAEKVQLISDRRE